MPALPTATPGGSTTTAGSRVSLPAISLVHDIARSIYQSLSGQLRRPGRPSQTANGRPKAKEGPARLDQCISQTSFTLSHHPVPPPFAVCMARCEQLPADVYIKLVRQRHHPRAWRHLIASPITPCHTTQVDEAHTPAHVHDDMHPCMGLLLCSVSTPDQARAEALEQGIA